MVELIPESNADPALATELLAFCRERIAHFKCPKSVDFVARASARHDNGKLYKHKLREQYRETLRPPAPAAHNAYKGAVPRN